MARAGAPSPPPPSVHEKRKKNDCLHDIGHIALIGVDCTPIAMVVTRTKTALLTTLNEAKLLTALESLVAVDKSELIPSGSPRWSPTISERVGTKNTSLSVTAAASDDATVSAESTVHSNTASINSTYETISFAPFVRAPPAPRPSQLWTHRADGTLSTDGVHWPLPRLDHVRAPRPRHAMQPCEVPAPGVEPQ